MLDADKLNKEMCGSKANLKLIIRHIIHEKKKKKKKEAATNSRRERWKNSAFISIVFHSICVGHAFSHVYRFE
jgi:hypothetical protein